MKFIGFELGTQASVDLSVSKFTVNGTHDAGRLQDIVDVFIKKYVLCTYCDNPETEIRIKLAKQEIRLRCLACGKSTKADSVHKIATLMMKLKP